MRSGEELLAARTYCLEDDQFLPTNDNEPLTRITRKYTPLTRACPPPKLSGGSTYATCATYATYATYATCATYAC